jgi:hypothetical protein
MKSAATYKKVLRFEAAWKRYIEAAQNYHDNYKGPKSKAWNALRSLRAAKKNLRTVCERLGESCPI